MSPNSRSLDGRLTIRLEVLPGNSVSERVELAAESGFDGIAFPGRFREKFGGETIASLHDLPIPVRSVSLGFQGSLCSPMESQRQLCRDTLFKLFEFTSELGANSVNMPPVLIQDNPQRFPSDDVDEQDKLLVEQLPLLGEEAVKFGLNLLLEPVNSFETDYLTTVNHAAKICEQVDHPSVGLTPDFYHMQMEEINVPVALKEAAKWIWHVHTAENTRVVPGPGQMNFRPGVRALKDSGYSGFVEVECRKLSGPASEVLPKSVDYLRREWDEA